MVAPRSGVLARMIDATVTTDRPLPIEAFDFALPRERVALRPAHPRDSARLLRVGCDGLSDHVVRDLPELLRPGDLVVLNDTKVIPARLVGRRRGAKVELTLNRNTGGGQWRALARPARKLEPGDWVEFAEAFAAEVIERGAEGEVVLRFNRTGAALLDALDRHGSAPLPPYIKRVHGPDARDRADYQTIFARAAGAVAAPTAGLHFTAELVRALDERGVRRAMVTLHVGADTFLPVRTADLRLHRMHGEHGVITPRAVALINEARRAGRRIVAVGSTSLRLLESAADKTGRLHAFAGDTRLFVTPGYRFKLVDLLLTNFHLPRSTLFVLVAAFGGLERMRAAYAHAVAEGYRFYSYGDCCLLERAEPK